MSGDGINTVRINDEVKHITELICLYPLIYSCGLLNNEMGLFERGRSGSFSLLGFTYRLPKVIKPPYDGLRLP